jgi:hypothetical protein
MSYEIEKARIELPAEPSGPTKSGLEASAGGDDVGH